MNSINIQDSEYNFSEFEYKLDNKTDKFTISGTRFNFNNNLVVLCNLKTINGSIDNEEFTYKTLSKDCQLRHYLNQELNVKLVNKISNRINNKPYFKIVENSDDAAAPSENLIKLNDIIDDQFKVDIDQLWTTSELEFCKVYDNFPIVPIFHYNGNNKKVKTPFLVELNIVIDILIQKFPKFREQLLTLSKLELNSTELKKESLESSIKNREEELLKEIKKLKNELNKKNKIIKEKNDKIDELIRKTDEQTKLLKEQQELTRKQLLKIDNQTETSNELNNKIDNQSRLLVKVTEKLDKLVYNILKLDKHLTSNTICKYKIILYTTEDITNKQSRDILEVSSFVGLIENSPNLTNVNVLLNKEVSCSVDSFKTVLTKLNSYVEGVKYRKIYIEKYNLERFIVKFNAELYDINNPVEELKNEVRNLSGKVTEISHLRWPAHSY